MTPSLTDCASPKHSALVELVNLVQLTW